jgi:hypothetical protein
VLGGDSRHVIDGAMTDRPLEGATAEKAVPFHRTSPIDLLAYQGGGLRLYLSAEMTIHAIALSSAVTIIGAVVAKLF